MNVTFLIGNGFDLNLGLKTRYTDFERVYCIPSDTDSKEIQAFKQLISKRFEDWADFEKAMGSYTNAFPLNDYDSFFTCLQDFKTEFSIYLKAEETRIQYRESMGLAVSLLTKLQTRRNTLDSGQRKRLHAKENLYSFASETYQFISFNYTKSLDALLDFTMNYQENLPEPINGNPSLGELIHVHGFWDDGMILGVNDSTQIANPTLNSIPSFAQLFQKPVINDSLPYHWGEDAEALITDSREIWVYGMSLGETDNYWWRCLGKWLKSNSDHCLVLCSRQSNLDLLNTVNVANKVLEVRWRFLHRAGLSEVEQSDVGEQIFVNFNSILFTFPISLVDCPPDDVAIAAAQFPNQTTPL